MTPVFISITSDGKLWVSDDVFYVPPGTLVRQFRVNPVTNSQLLCTLTGSGNASASALACVVATKSGKAEGNEIH